MLARAGLFLLVLPLIGFPALSDTSIQKVLTFEGVRLAGHFIQGGLITGQAAPGVTVTFDGRILRQTPAGTFLLGFGRDHPPTAALAWRLPDGQERSVLLDIEKRAYQVQRIDGLPKRMVTPPEETLQRIRSENRAIAAVRARDSETAWFESGFIWPAIGRISGVFGSQRILNGKPRRPHFGIDIAAPTGTAVVAPADGIVAMAEKDLYYTGGTVMIDHGHGLTSVYSHLSELSVEPGHPVRQGVRIGSVGSTGRSTGPHLDWRINWFKQRLDPALFVGPMPNTPETPEPVRPSVKPRQG